MSSANFLKFNQKESLPSDKKNRKGAMRNLFKKRKELGVNLMSPEIVKEVSRQIERRNLIQIAMSFLFACGLVGFSYLGIFLYGYTNAKNLEPVQDRLKAVNQAISSLEAQTATLAGFQNTLSSVASLLSQHMYWTRFLRVLESVTLQDVKYDSVSVNSGSNALTLNGIARTYRDIGKQVRAFQKATYMFPEVSVTTANAIIDQAGQVIGVKFTLSLTVNLDTIKGLGNGTSTPQ